MRMDAERRAKAETLRKLLGVAVTTIAILLVIDMRWMSASTDHGRSMIPSFFWGWPSHLRTRVMCLGWSRHMWVFVFVQSRRNKPYLWKILSCFFCQRKPCHASCFLGAQRDSYVTCTIFCGCFIKCNRYTWYVVCTKSVLYVMSTYAKLQTYP